MDCWLLANELMGKANSLLYTKDMFNDIVVYYV